ncbi:rho GTPase-activating protein gacK-like [Aricia agestis]|uniref:rho GTPase-activating protein gacK-like n=1 Tax=Aricia agestis TaxID=91739 RepID=UPI001C20BE83|nr:rho GTPase-activating protein gacK-like [Aricia agestis]
MYRINLVLLVLCSASQAVYVNRMSTINRVRAPPPFRPGVMLRPMYQQRLVATPSHRPYIMYRNTPQSFNSRYAIKKFNASPVHFNTRNVFWKSTTPRLPLPTTPVVPPTPEFDFVRSASSPPIVSADGTGAIHTIPAPNLSLSEKPIVVIDSENNAGNAASFAHASKPSYEVTERHPEQSYHTGKISQPAGFSKPQEFAPIDYQNIRANAALQFASEYGLPAIQMPQQSFTPQQYSMQGLFHGINGLPAQFPENILHHREPEGIVIPPNPIFQSDPTFLQKLQAQLMQQYPTLEFIPYAPDVQPQSIPQPSESEPQIYLLKNNQIVKQEPSAFVPSENKNVVQRETEEKSVIPLIPQAFSLNNSTENNQAIDTTTAAQPVNVTLVEVISETQTPPTTIRYVIEANENEKTTPIYFSQVGQTMDNVIANNIFSALPVVREQPQTEPPVTVSQAPSTTTTTEGTTTTTTIATTTQFEQKTPTTPKILNEERKHPNINLNLIGSPFEKTAESVNVAYTILRTNDNQSVPKLSKDGSIYAGQLVEAKVSEDQDFNKEKATFAKRAPLRLFGVTEKLNTEPPKINVVKTNFPPKSKLTFDDKTGEPVLRIYASYMDNPFQKEQLTTRVSNMRTTTMGARKQDNQESWKGAGNKEKLASLASDPNRESQFGLKLKSRSDDYNIPLFDDYE